MAVSTWHRGRLAWRSLSPAGQAGAVFLGVGALMAIAAWTPETWRGLGLGVALVVMSLAGLIDMAERRLPNELALLAAACVVATGVAVTVAQGFEVGAGVALSVLAGAALFGGPMLVLHLVSPAGMGFGDVKAGVVLGATVGVIDAWSCLVGLFVGSALTAVIAVAGRHRAVPFGPGLVAGAEVALVIARLRGISPVT